MQGDEHNSEPAVSVCSPIVLLVRQTANWTFPVMSLLFVGIKLQNSWHCCCFLFSNSLQAIEFSPIIEWHLLSGLEVGIVAHCRGYNDLLRVCYDSLVHLHVANQRNFAHCLTASCLHTKKVDRLKDIRNVVLHEMHLFYRVCFYQWCLLHSCIVLSSSISSHPELPPTVNAAHLLLTLLVFV